MKTKGVMIAATGSGCGKTTITCGLLQAFLQQGKKVISYKCGPDYIDPMFHRQVLQIWGGNLDSFFLEKTKMRQQVLHQLEKQQPDFCVVEGVMGLYDGLGGVSEVASCYEVACFLDLPIVLVVSGKGMGPSILSVIKGFLADDKEHRIKGIIINQVSASYGTVLKQLIEEKLQISVLGCIPSLASMEWQHRHLGLFLPEEICSVKEQLEAFAQVLQSEIVWSQLEEIGAGWNYQDWKEKNSRLVDSLGKREQRWLSSVKKEKQELVIAVAKDAAFSFYYQENLELLEELGARLVYFSPLQDKKLPPNTSGILLGGGYPENYARELSENKGMLSAIKKAYQEKIPMLAECGGFLYLHQRLEGMDKKTYEVVGIVTGEAKKTNHLVRFGYVTIDGCTLLSEQKEIKGHEFHYYESTNSGEDCIAKKPLGNKSWSCIHAKEGNLWGFPHLFYPSAPELVVAFLEKCLEGKKERNK